MEEYLNELRNKQPQISLSPTAKILKLKNFKGRDLAIKDKRSKSSDPFLKIAAVFKGFNYTPKKSKMSKKDGLTGKHNKPHIRLFVKSKVIQIFIVILSLYLYRISNYL